MTIDSLKEFITIADEQNYYEAAEKLSISQAALSQHISKLEQELEHKLFVLQKQKTILTPYGRFFYPYALSILETYEKYENDALNLFSSDLTIGILQMLKAYHLQNIIAGFSQASPGIDLTVDESPASQLLSCVETHQIDAAFVFRALNSDGTVNLPRHFQYVDLYHDEFAVMLPEFHKLSGLEHISKETLRNETFLRYPRELFQTGDSLFTPHIIYTGNIENLGPLLRSSDKMIAILQYQEAMRQADGTTIQVRRLVPHEEWALCLVYLKNNSKKELKQFIKYTKNHFQELCQPHFYQ